MSSFDALTDSAWPELWANPMNDTPTRATWTVGSPIDDGWGIVATLAMQDGRLVVERFAIEPLPGAVPVGGVTATTLRSVRLASFVDAARGLIGDPGPLASDKRRKAAEVVAEADGTTRGRPRMLTDDYLREVALSRLAADRAGVKATRRWMVADLASRGAFDRLGMRRDDSQVRDDVKRARDAGWLGPAQQGSRGAMPGPRLLEERVGDGRDDG